MVACSHEGAISNGGLSVSIGAPTNAIDGEEVAGNVGDIEIIESQSLFSPEHGEMIYTVLVKNNSSNVASQINLSPIAKSSSGELVGSESTSGGRMNYVGPGETVAICVELIGCNAEPETVEWSIKVPKWFKPNNNNTYKLIIGATSVGSNSSDQTRARAEVSNTSDMDFSAVSLVAVFKDGSGRIVGSAEGSEMAVDAGMSVAIETDSIFPREPVSTASVDYYTSWQLAF